MHMVRRPSCAQDVCVSEKCLQTAVFLRREARAMILAAMGSAQLHEQPLTERCRRFS